MSRKSGVALITVLLVVFLAAVSASSLAFLQQINIRRSALLLHQQQARLYTLGAEQWASRVLLRDRDNSTVDHLEETWAVMSPVLPVDGGFVSGRLEDLQGRYSLNNLLREGVIDDRQIAILSRLLEQLDLDPDLAQAIADWIDEDQDVRFPGGAEDGEYLRDGYLAANRPFNSVTELRLVNGVDESIYAALAPFVSALPEFAPVNVNTAPPAVLAALAEELDNDQAQDLSETRRDDEFSSVAAFVNAANLQQVDTLDPGSLSVSSRFFLLRAEASVADSRFRLISILYRPQGGSVSSYQRSFGDAI